MGHFLNVQIDGYLGLAVALFILWSGISLVKETVSPLLGEAPDPDLVNNIEKQTMNFDGVLGIHDLVVHNYGPGKIFASVHIEVDSDVDVMLSHDLVDNIEKQISHDLHLLLTAHMDPVNTHDPNREPLSNIIKEAISEIPGVLSFHDLRIVPGSTHTNVIFDVVVSSECKESPEKIRQILQERIAGYNPAFCSVVEIDNSYIKNK